mgnify:CR=1 FL=1
MLKLYALASRLFLRLTGARRRVLEDGPVSLVYYAAGPVRGEPWVLLHGLGGVGVPQLHEAPTWGTFRPGLTGSRPPTANVATR